MKEKQFCISDRDLWNSFISGEEDSFKIIYEKYAEGLFKFGRHFTDDKEIIKDSIQDLFVDLYNYRNNLKQTDNIKSYLMVSLKRNIFKKIKAESKFKTLNVESAPFEYQIVNESTSIEVDKKMKSLQHAIKELTPRQREAIYLKYISGLDYDELSTVLKLSYPAARNLIYRAMESLRKSMVHKIITLFSFHVVSALRFTQKSQSIKWDKA